jgi:EAL domain-containing protein (putative c-di-GMP-specific phosphodiesterase class I)
VLQASGLPAEQLQLEITESASLQDMDTTVQILEELRRMGLQIAIDDFGTSYSSMGYLRRFPINAIKIDYTFIRDITTDLDDAAIVSTIVAMGHVLNLKVVAEGVETQEQADFLAPQKCDELQGFLLGRPSPAEHTADLLRSRSRLLRNILPPEDIRV